MDSTQLEKHAELHSRLGILIHRTLLSLICCYDNSDNSCLFYPAIDTLPDAAHSTFQGKPNAGDTAALLLALERVSDSMRRQSKQDSLGPDFWAEFWKSLDTFYTKGKIEPISYDSYRATIFEPSLRKIAAARSDTTPSIDEILGHKGQPDPSRSPFKAARILSLMNKFPDEESHQDLYMEALDCVLKSVTRAYPPHYIFGGASLTGTEANSFITHECLTALADIAVVLEKRSEEHRAVSSLIDQIDKWCSDSDDRISRIHATSFGAVLQDGLSRLENPVGLTPVFRKLMTFIPMFASDKVDPNIKKQTRNQISAQLKAAIVLDKKSPSTVRNWLNGFRTRVVEKIKSIDATIASEYETLLRTDTTPLPEPGAASMALTRPHHRQAGTLWRRAFFEGMKEVLEKTDNIYKENIEVLPGPNGRNASRTLQPIAKAIASAGRQWELSAKRTRVFLNLLSKWSQAEIERQITLYSLKQQTNFDPVQLAFAASTYQKTALSPNAQLIEKAREIVFESQTPDGTWPLGAPFCFDRVTLAANYAANLEIVNALVPSIEKEFVPKYRQMADRVFDWLEFNVRLLSLDKPMKGKGGANSGENKTLTIVGWSTDGIFESGRIDCWMTAAALHFFVFYRRLLQQDVNEHLAQSYDLKHPHFAWSDVVDAQIKARFEKRITTRIYEDFIVPFRDTGRNDRSAMILHGPPGTAKTTLAEAIASELKWNLITITPSDFVKEGLENSEKSARLLFKHLMQFRDAVVLFDEIDEMLRDRQGDESLGGVSMLRFIVPGMLPKLQSLKQYGEKNRLIFIVSTNYVDRLDAAITRTGRIDERYAVVPPDEQARYCLIKKFIEDEDKKRGVVPKGSLSPKHKISQTGIDHARKIERDPAVDLAEFLASKTNGWVVKELQLLVTSLPTSGITVSDLKNKVIPVKITRKLQNQLISAGLGRDVQTKLLPNKIWDRGPSLDLFRFYRSRENAKPELKRVLPSYGLSPDSDPDSDTGTVTDKVAKVIVELGKNKNRRSGDLKS